MRDGSPTVEGERLPNRDLERAAVSESNLERDTSHEREQPHGPGRAQDGSARLLDHPLACHSWPPRHEPASE